MRIWVTSFVWDGIEYVGPSIYAKTKETALAVAESEGLVLEGELVGYVPIEDLDEPQGTTDKIMLH
tara:strand:+ start:213 stop:410 length:198 start_codon:yes stop_codon:yes gene_type:complete